MDDNTERSTKTMMIETERWTTTMVNGRQRWSTYWTMCGRPQWSSVDVTYTETSVQHKQCTYDMFTSHIIYQTSVCQVAPPLDEYVLGVGPPNSRNTRILIMVSTGSIINGTIASYLFCTSFRVDKSNSAWSSRQTTIERSRSICTKHACVSESVSQA